MDESLREQLTAGAAGMGVALNAAALVRFSTYLALLQAWGKKINLTTRLGAEEVVVYHFLDSLCGVPVLAATPSARVVDLGAGAGLPSLPLKFALPELRLLLVESVRKKVAFCQEVIRSTDVADTEALWGRGEDLSLRPEHRGAYDWAVSRALGSAAEVAGLALPFLAPGGRILLYKGKPEPGELNELDLFCAKHRATWELRRVAVPYLEGDRSLIIVDF